MKIDTVVDGDTTVVSMTAGDYEQEDIATEMAALFEDGYTFVTSYESEGGSATTFIFVSITD